ncbi:WD40-repeat-containing domain protein [Gorgonomyces haynaldii]|nr:WD40-repeat-containing domain protein [Gorgonomyces haynaldii]
MDSEKATKLLKTKVDTLERENNQLKKSLFELSSRYNAIAYKLQPFKLGDVLDQKIDDISPLVEMPQQEQVQDPFVPQRERDKQFYQKHELKGHLGAVYCVLFSPCGRFISSGSFDKTVRVWEYGGLKEMHCLRKHNLNVSDLSWSSDSQDLVSGSYDQTCNTWDVEGGKLMESFQSDGFVQCVTFSSDKSVFYCGTSRNGIGIYDRRTDGGLTLTIKNNAMVNSIVDCPENQTILTGDALGCIKTWDIRTAKLLNNFSVENSKSISHLEMCSTDIRNDSAIRIAVNSYDNVIRVYDSIYNAQTSASNYKLTHALKGYKNKNWPIRSSFYYNPESAQFGRPSLTDELYKQEKELEITSMLATGSADPYVYNSGELFQRLEGHTDRVYDVHFHPKEATLASCSADFSIKLWTFGRKRKS